MTHRRDPSDKGDPSETTGFNGNSRRASPFAGDRERGGYNLYDPRHFDSGGFGFGGTSGSASGFGVGGNGPQTSDYGSQANYGQGNGGADFNPGAGDSRYSTAPDEPASPESRQRRHIFDDQYLSWRGEQLRKLDDDYHAYRQEHQGKFNEDFNVWRGKRANSQLTGSANDVAKPPVGD